MSFEHGHVFLSGTCTGTRIDAWTKDRKVVNLTWEIRWYGGNLQHPGVWIIGGPTGHESMSMEDVPKAIKRLAEKGEPGWYACAGTPMRWDTLIIPLDDLRNILDSWNATRSHWGL